jgi:hypothetical protein
MRGARAFSSSQPVIEDEWGFTTVANMSIMSTVDLLKEGIYQ